MTKQIQLTQGQVAIVDDEDFALVYGRKWYAHKNKNTYYAKTWVAGENKTISMHRLILGNSELVTDHIDGDGLNNTRKNLRRCTRQQNGRNQVVRTYPGKASRYKGVFLDRKWKAQITVNGKYKFLGRFENEIDAAHAYDKAAKELFGEFARLNFPEGQTQ